MAAKIRRNDKIIVLTGKDKGKCSKVKKILANGKAIVEGINLVKKHQKPVPSINQPDGILEKEAAIDLSNLAILNTCSGRADRVGFKIVEGKKVRFLKSNGKTFK